VEANNCFVAGEIWLEFSVSELAFSTLIEESAGVMAAGVTLFISCWVGGGDGRG